MAAGLVYNTQTVVQSLVDTRSTNNKSTLKVLTNRDDGMGAVSIRDKKGSMKFGVSRYEVSPSAYLVPSLLTPANP